MVEIVTRFVDCHVFRRRNGVVEWLVLKRAPHCVVPNTWQMVQGGIEAGETAWQAAYRELTEETGLRPLRFFQGSCLNRFYMAHSDQVVLSPVFCAEVGLDQEVRLNHEHTAYRWVRQAEAEAGFPWPGQVTTLRIVSQQFAYGLPRPESDITDLVQPS